jgi:hypothetical protein
MDDEHANYKGDAGTLKNTKENTKEYAEDAGELGSINAEWLKSIGGATSPPSSESLSLSYAPRALRMVMHSSMLGESSLRHSIPNQHANIDAEDYTLSLLSKPLISLACLHVADRSVGRSVGGVVVRRSATT